ncbi:MAG: DUF3987 domain-containing protein [Bacteroidaceae bacterium]|nr:DUF3987 domain-containing protein [Bacteroidaceae bacterium]
MKTTSNEQQNLKPILCGMGITSGIIEMTMEQYLTHVKSRFYTTQVEAMRRETDPTRRDQLKRRLFYILPQGQFKEGRRSYALGQQPTKENIGYRPMQMLDLDTLPEGCTTPADAWYRMRLRLHDMGLAHYPLVVMESVSGKGLHIYVRLTEEMAAMNRREVILLWSRLLGADFDLSVTDPARRAFQSYNLFSAEEEIALLFGAELTDKQREAMKEIENSNPVTLNAVNLQVAGSKGKSKSLANDSGKLPPRDPSDATLCQDDNIARRGNIAVPNSEFRINNSELAAIAQRLLLHLCGTTTPPEGTRNNTLYEAARQMAYLDGVTEEELIDAFAPLGYLGLPEQEARACMHSAMQHEKTWKYTLPPELTKAMEELTIDKSQLTIGSATTQSNDEGNDCQFNSGSLPELVSLFTPLVPENAREAVAAMVFSPLGSYLNNTVTIRDVSGKRRSIQFTSLIVGNSSSGKGFADTISDLITERHRQRDLSSWAQIEAWQEQKRTTPKGEPAPLKPQVPLHLLSSNMTEPALLERLKALEPTHGRAYIKVAEIDDLRKMQTVGTSRLGAGQEIILSAFDTSPYGALRVSADAVSTMTVMSLNVVASSTFPGTQDFFRGGVERGSVGRCDMAIVPDSYDVPRYQDPTPEFHEQLALYIDRLEQATGEIACPDIDRTIEDIRLQYSDPDSPLSHYHNPEHFKLCHRQLLITKQKATILYICNNYQWDTAWEPWLHHAFHYGMQCKLSVFAAEIASWEKRQVMAATPHTTSYGPKGELSELPHTFTLDNLVERKRIATPTATDKELITRAKTLIRTWLLRGRIAPTDTTGVWEKL